MKQSAVRRCRRRGGLGEYLGFQTVSPPPELLRSATRSGILHAPQPCVAQPHVRGKDFPRTPTQVEGFRRPDVQSRSAYSRIEKEEKRHGIRSCAHMQQRQHCTRTGSSWIICHCERGSSRPFPLPLVGEGEGDGSSPRPCRSRRRALSTLPRPRRVVEAEAPPWVLWRSD